MVADQIQILLFVEPELNLNSEKPPVNVELCVSVDGNAGTSTTSVGPKFYALLLSERKENCPFVEILEKNGIERITKSTVAPSPNVQLEVIEIFIKQVTRSKADLISAFRGDIDLEPPKPFKIYCDPSNTEFVQQLFSRSLDIKFDGSLSLDYFHSERDTMEADFKAIEAWLRPRADIPFRNAAGGTLLHFAAQYGYVSLLELLLKFGANIHLQRSDGSTALHLAAWRLSLFNYRPVKVSCSNIVRLLLKHGAKVKVKKNNGSTPLHEATPTGCMEIICMLLQAGAEINAETDHGTTALHIAASLGVTFILLVKFFILECGANVNATNASGRTPILCTLKNSPKVIQLLVENGADINVESNEGETLLFDVILRGSLETINYVLSLYPSADIEGNKKAFYLAVSKGGEKYDKVVKQMISQGFLPIFGPEDAKNTKLLFGAIEKQLIEFVQALLSYGADVNQYHLFGGSNLTPLYLAIKCNDVPMVKFLLNHGADVNAKRGSRLIPHALITPLSYVEHSSVEIVKILMMANPNDQDDPKLLEIVVAKAGPHMVEFLLQKGMDPNFVNFKGETPMSIAVRNANLKAIKMLVRFGVACKFTDLTSDRIKDPSVLEDFLGHCFTDIGATGECNVKKLLDINAYSTRKNFFHTSGCAQILTQHLIKMEVAKKHITIKSLVPNRLYNKYGLAAFKDECKAEIKRMEVENVGPVEVKFYDILTKNTHQIACYARNQSIVKALESPELKIKYPIYANVLCGKFFEGKSQNTVLEESVKAFDLLCKSARLKKLPFEVILLILNFLNNKELFFLRKCNPLK